MTHVATLISHPDANVLDRRLANEIAGRLPHGRIGRVLQDGVALDILFQPRASTRADLQALSRQIRTLCEAARVDIVVQADNADRRKKLLIADMDSTMIGQECIDELADFAGVRARVSAITERAMRGEIAFEPALRERVALLKGLPVTIVDEVIASRIHLTPGAKTLIATMRAHGATTALISGGFTLFTRPIAKMLGFETHQANELLVHNGHLTGEVAEPILGREAKRAALARLRVQHGLVPEATLAVGDGANDLDMLGEAGLGIAYHAKPQVAAAADASIGFGDLTALLFAQGYGRDEFVA